MKTVGIVGITAEGASDCYKSIVRLSGERLGDNRHPEVVLVNPPFDTILAAQKERDWQRVADIITGASQKCVLGGAEFIIVPANSVHFAYDLIAQKLDVPAINIVDVVIDRCSKQGFKKVAILGVGLTMSDGLYDKTLESNNIEQVKLSDVGVQNLDSIIYDELVKGTINQASVRKVLKMCNKLASEGCEALILACTELPMILNADNAPLPLLDSTELLAVEAVNRALE